MAKTPKRKISTMIGNRITRPTSFTFFDRKGQLRIASKDAKENFLRRKIAPPFETIELIKAGKIRVTNQKEAIQEVMRCDINTALSTFGQFGFKVITRSKTSLTLRNDKGTTVSIPNYAGLPNETVTKKMATAIEKTL
ncbi:hypothetical protein KKB11_01725, partial [Candidatus Micrarchaeota archaeon]|nr:hypothetical protein [Candidatus Micrarchaeota archaeon]